MAQPTSKPLLSSRSAALLVAFVALCVNTPMLCALLPPRRLRVPAHMVGNAYYEEGLLSPEKGAMLRELLKELKEYPSNTADVSFYKTLREHVGEAQPIANGSCTDPFLVPDQSRTLCVLPGRIDIGRHFILTGGPTLGLRESYESVVSRVQSFGRYIFELEKHPEVKALFDQPNFLALARRVCPAEKQFLDPFQFNFILQLPGQTVAAHVDGVYFWGATRFQFPQWLLATMAFSGRFVERFVDQVQVVGYVHEWEVASREKAGEFIHWATPDATAPADERARDVAVRATSHMPVSHAGTAVDGSKLVHAAEIYLGSAASPPLPRIDKSRHNVLQYEGPSDQGGWALRSDGEVLQRYDTDDIRSSIVYRARCFRDAEEAQRFGGVGGPAEEILELDEVLRTLCDEMVARGALRSIEEGMAMDRKRLALRMIDTFIKYPLPSRDVRLMPYNYCALPRTLPSWAAPLARGLLRPACGT